MFGGFRNQGLLKNGSKIVWRSLSARDAISREGLVRLLSCHGGVVRTRRGKGVPLYPGAHTVPFYRYFYDFTKFPLEDFVRVNTFFVSFCSFLISMCNQKTLHFPQP